MAAGADNNVLSTFGEKALVFLFNDGCTNGSFLSANESQLNESISQIIYTNVFIVGDKGGRNACINGRAGINKNLSCFDSVCNFLGILGANNEAMAAEDAFVADYISLISREADAFDGAMADAF